MRAKLCTAPTFAYFRVYASPDLMDLRLKSQEKGDETMLVLSAVDMDNFVIGSPVVNGAKKSVLKCGGKQQPMDTDSALNLERL